METFLIDFLRTWDGDWAREVVFDLIALVPPKSFEGRSGHPHAPPYPAPLTFDRVHSII